jgi:Ca2+-binding EF-hand superfamily protein
MQPEGLRNKYDEAVFKAWFDSADLDSTGVLSIDQFFLWTLENASVRHGEAILRKVFAQYDPDRSGVLDAFEFHKACDDIGFGLVSSLIFRALDPDGSGTVSYGEVMQALHADGALVSPGMQKQIKEVILSAEIEAKKDARKVIDTKGWVIQGSSVRELKTQMRQRLNESGPRL